MTNTTDHADRTNYYLERSRHYLRSAEESDRRGYAALAAQATYLAARFALMAARAMER